MTETNVVPMQDPAVPPPAERPALLLDDGVERCDLLARRVRNLYRSGGLPKGDSTGWPMLDPFYRIQTGQWTVVTGIPGAGKSELVDAIAMNLAESAEWDFAFYSPENCPTEGHVIKLLEKHVRMPFGLGPTERMGEEQITEGMRWLFSRFFWLRPAVAAPEELITMGAERAREGRKLGIVLDPWNTLDHERDGMTETDYISRVLTMVNRIVRGHNIHVWLVVHPAKINRDREGKRPVPTPYDISGSAHWFNKADNILCVHREKTGGQDVEIHVQKVRFKHLGGIGLVTLKYDKVVGRYFEWDGPVIENEFYADPERRS